MTEQGNDLDFKHLFRLVFVQGGQVAIGTAIGAGVLLLVGLVAILLSPVLAPLFLYLHWRRQKAAADSQPPATRDAAPELTPDA